MHMAALREKIAVVERACTTASSVLFSKSADPLTTRTRFGTTSARRWYWFSTSAHAAFTPSSRSITWSAVRVEAWKRLRPVIETGQRRRARSSGSTLRISQQASGSRAFSVSSGSARRRSSGEGRTIWTLRSPRRRESVRW